MTEETPATDLANGDDQAMPSASTTLQSLRKGGSLFGKSASSSSEPVEIQEKVTPIDEASSSGDLVNTTEVVPSVPDENNEVLYENAEPIDKVETARNGDDTSEGEGSDDVLTAHEVSTVISGDAKPDAEDQNGTTEEAADTNVSIQEQSEADEKVNESTGDVADISTHTAMESEEVEEIGEEEAAESAEESKEEEAAATEEAEEREHVSADVSDDFEQIEKEDVSEKAEEKEDEAETAEEVSVGGAVPEKEAMETEEAAPEDDSGKREELSEDAPELMDVEEPCELKILAPETVDEDKKDKEEDAKEEAEAVEETPEETEAEEPEEDTEVVEATPKRAAATPRGKARSAKKTAETPKETPKRTPRRGAAAKPDEDEKESTPETQKTPKSHRRTRAVAADVEETGESNSVKAEEVEEPVKTPKNAISARRGAADAKTPKTPAGKTVVAKETDDEEEDDEEEEVPQPRSLRTRSAKIDKTPSTPKASTQRASRGSAVKSESATPKSRVQKVDKESTESAPRSSRRSAASKSTPAQAEAVEKTPKSSRSKKASKSEDETPKRAAAKESDAEDPYDVTTQLDQHPEPLKNIHMKVQSFGDMKFQRVGSGKYTATEKAAEERVGNLSDMVPKAKERRSLAELTPGRGRTAATPKNFKSAPARRNRSKAEETEDMDVDEETTPARGSSRKRKASPAPGTPPKKAAVSAPELTEDQQWEVDHPGDEGAHLEVGARVYAVFSKVYYPAIVISERDAHGRYKVQFVEDKVVRDVPTAGLVPLRAVVAGKECFYDENGASVIASPNAASAPEWVKGIFKIEVEDQDDVIEVEWSKLSLDMNDWKDYIHQKSLEATAVATDNIASSKSRRSRVDIVASEVVTPVTKSPASRTSAASSKKKTPKKETASVSTPKSAKAKKAEKEPEEEKEDVQEAEKEAVDNGGSEEPEEPAATALFKGMMFILTSAQRDGSSNFKKKLMSDFIQQSEGLVFEDFSEVDAHPEMDAYLISDTHYRTHKYLSAMARGVPCVSHEWILKCRESGSLVKNDEYLLPAGVSILDQKTYELPKNQADLLKDKVVLVHSNNRPSSAKALNFIQIWEPMIGLLGGQAITDAEQSSKIDIMLTDASATPELLEKARGDDAIIVSSEWLIQGIIMDKLSDPSAHPRFQIDTAAAGSR